MQNHSDLEIELANQNRELIAEYEQLRRLRAEVAGLLFPLKRSRPRKRFALPSKRPAARLVQFHRPPAASPPILLLSAWASFDVRTLPTHRERRRREVRIPAARIGTAALCRSGKRLKRIAQDCRL